MTPESHLDHCDRVAAQSHKILGIRGERHDKGGYVFLGTVAAATLLICLRT
ncbi:hypothetical protein [Nonomuraea sp. NPDC048916]|uniref:hypothetical protein n=1 Tax=Nonomuraea sp. NPDC048916 TaxID=3154232 RepID=UPI0033F3EED2